MYVDSSACVRVKGAESGQFKKDSRVRHGCIMSPWLLNVYMDRVMKVKMGMERRGVRFLDDGSERRLPGLLYADDLVLCDESEDLRGIVDGLLRCEEGKD